MGKFGAARFDGNGSRQGFEAFLEAFAFEWKRSDVSL